MKDLKNIKFFIFDLDNTLYSADSGIFQQVGELMGKYLSECLNIEIDEAKKIQKKYPKTIGEVRGKGLMVGIELVKDETIKNRTPDVESTNRIMEETKKRGLLIGRGGLYGNSLRIAPALNIGPNDIDEALQIINDSFKAL